MPSTPDCSFLLLPRLGHRTDTHQVHKPHLLCPCPHLSSHSPGHILPLPASVSTAQAPWLHRLSTASLWPPRAVNPTFKAKEDCPSLRPLRKPSRTVAGCSLSAVSPHTLFHTTPHSSPSQSPNSPSLFPLSTSNNSAAHAAPDHQKLASSQHFGLSASVASSESSLINHLSRLHRYPAASPSTSPRLFSSQGLPLPA